MISTPKSIKSFPVGVITKKRKETKQEKAKIELGTSVTVKVGVINEKVREVKFITTRKDLVGRR